jgi:hypothetical protein
MRFEIDAEPSPGLHVIPLIPDIPMCRIEGRNGIGKTLAIRLLQLCTGDQPYATMPAAWLTLKEHLGEVIIRASALRGGESIEWRLDPDRWPAEPSALDASTLGDVMIDGAPATLSEVRSLLRVLRIAGDETLPETIAYRISEDAALVRRAHGDITRRIETLDQRLDALNSDLTRLNVERLASARSDLRTLNSDLIRLQSEHDEATKRTSLLGQAQRLQNTVATIRRDAPDLRAEIRRLDEELQAARSRRKQLEAEADTLRPRQEQRHRLARRYEEQQKVVNRRMGNYERTTARAMRLAAQLDVDLDRSAVAAAAAEDRRELTQVTQERSELDATPVVEQVARDVATPLSRAVDRGLGQHEIAEMELGRITISQLYDGVERRQQSLAALPMPAAARRLDERIKILHDRLEKSEQLMGLLRRADTNRQSLKDAEESLHRIAEELSGADTERYKVVADQLSEARNVEVELNYRRTEAVRHLGQLGEGKTLEDTIEALSVALKDAGMEAGELDAELSRANERVASIQEGIRQTTARVQAAKATVLDQLAGLRLAINLFEHGADYQWLRRTVGAYLPSGSLPEDENLRRVARLQHGADAVRERISSLGDQVLAVSYALDELASVVAGRAVPSGARFVPQLRSYYEGLLTKEFDSREISNALFDDGTFERLNLSNLSVIWRDTTRRTHTRPLEAFSSGQRAFAYTLARLVSSDPVQAANRVLALDEFGAHVAHDRLAQLIQILETRILGVTAEQVIVILPLSQDYIRLGEGVDGVDRSRQVAEYGYFADTFSIPQ